MTSTGSDWTDVPALSETARQLVELGEFTRPVSARRWYTSGKTLFDLVGNTITAIDLSSGRVLYSLENAKK